MSKRKPKKNRPARKPRWTHIQITFGTAGSGKLRIHGDSVSIVGDDGQVVLPSHVEVASTFQRDNGKSPKVIARATSDPSAISTNVNRVLSQYSSLFAVDTNTRKVCGIRVSVSVVLELSSLNWTALEFHDAREPPEHLGWFFAVTKIQELQVATPIALVVDSDLDALPAINERKRPYFANHVLPDGFTLVYASSDSGRAEYSGNKALAMCDARATTILRKIEALSTSARQFMVDPSLPLMRFHIW